MSDATGGIALMPLDEQQPSLHIERTVMIQQFAGS
jgi:hypothetical protein